MSEEKTRAVVSRWFNALEIGDNDTAMACLDDNVHWINNPAEKGKPGGIPGLSAIIPWLGDFSNKAEVMESFEIWGERQEVIKYEHLNMMFEGDQALVLVHEVARVKATGLVYDVEFVQRIKVVDDVIVFLQIYLDTSKEVPAFRGNMSERLLNAARTGNTNEAELVLPFGANPNQTDTDSTESALMIAAENNHVEMLKMLLSYGAEPNLISRKFGNTALHSACRNGNLDSIKVLLKAGAFINIQKPTTGETPLHEALKHNFPDCVTFLIEAGANKDVLSFNNKRLEDIATESFGTN